MQSRHCRGRYPRRWLRGRYVRTSNRDVIGVPDRAVAPGQRPPWLRRASTGQRQESVSKQEALDEMLRAAAAAPDLLLRRRLAWEGTNLGGGRTIAYRVASIAGSVA